MEKLLHLKNQVQKNVEAKNKSVFMNTDNLRNIYIFQLFCYCKVKSLFVLSVADRGFDPR